MYSSLSVQLGESLGVCLGYSHMIEEICDSIHVGCSHMAVQYTWV